nr:glycosyltransferase family 2 protein [Maricaulis parjimensis]
MIVAYASRDTLPRCLEALSAQTVRPREVILLENGSPDGQRIQAGEVPDWVEFIESPENLGYAAGNNRLAERAKGEWLALLNPDAFAHPDWLEQLWAATQRYPEISLFGSTQYCAEKPELLDGAGDVYHAAGLAYRGAYLRPVSMLPIEGEVFAPCGAAAFVKADLFRALNGFDESFFCYNEDVDLAFRARLAGQRVIQLRYAAVDHAGYGSSGRRSDFATYYGVRNRLWVFLKDVPGWLFWLLLPVHAFATLCLWFAAMKSKQFGLFSRAIWDGLKDWPRIMRARRAVQAERKVSVLQVARMMSWRSRQLLTREPDIRSYKESVTPD